MLFKVQIDRSQPQYIISTEVDRNTPWRQVSSGTHIVHQQRQRSCTGFHSSVNGRFLFIVTKWQSTASTLVSYIFKRRYCWVISAFRITLSIDRKQRIMPKQILLFFPGYFGINICKQRSKVITVYEYVYHSNIIISIVSSNTLYKIQSDKI